MKIAKDGDAYLVHADNFVNLQESEDYFFVDIAEVAEFEETLKREGIQAAIHVFETEYAEAQSEGLDQNGCYDVVSKALHDLLDY